MLPFVVDTLVRPPMFLPDPEISHHLLVIFPSVIFGALIVFGIIEGAITSWLVRQYQHGEDSYPNGAFRDRLRFAV